MTTFLRRTAPLVSPLLAFLTIAIGWRSDSPVWLRLACWIGLTLYNTLWWLLVVPSYSLSPVPDPDLRVEGQRLARRTWRSRLVSAALLVIVALLGMGVGSGWVAGAARSSFVLFHGILLGAILLSLGVEYRRLRGTLRS